MLQQSGDTILQKHFDIGYIISFSNEGDNFYTFLLPGKATQGSYSFKEKM